jgi:cyclic pyranopterin phosphate synthase
MHWKERKYGAAPARAGEPRDPDARGNERAPFDAGARGRPSRGDRDTRPPRFEPGREGGERAFKPRAPRPEFRGEFRRDFRGGRDDTRPERPPGRSFEKKPYAGKRDFKPRFERDAGSRPYRPREDFASRPRREFTHLNQRGEAHMVDVGAKAATQREAVAEGMIRMQPETLAKIIAGGFDKGDVLATARIAGIMAAKKTAELIPLCHQLPLTHAEVVLEARPDDNAVHCRATCATKAETGVEMEALLATEVALLTIYDMCKAIDRGMEIGNVRLLSKRGGQSGDWQRSEAVPQEPPIASETGAED